MVVASDHQGRGVYRSAIKALGEAWALDKPEAWLLGSIHPDNFPSRRSAQAQGRIDLIRKYEIPCNT